MSAFDAHAHAKASTVLRRPDAPPPVLNCDDHGPGSLRDAINQAASGDTIDLSALACSTITLSGGEIAIAQDDLIIHGPGQPLSISAGGASRIFNHEGAGTLTIDRLTVANGHYHSGGGVARGGCIKSSGSMYLNRATVKNCELLSNASNALGGGIYAPSVTLVLSEISENSVLASAPGTKAHGGGIATTGDLIAKYSSISHNRVQNYSLGGGYGGGLAVGGYASIAGSTVDANKASRGSAASLYEANIVNSTVSGNVANEYWAVAFQGTYAAIYNSTIAFNHSNAEQFAAVYFHGTSFSSSLRLQSSIVANNTIGNGDTPADIYVVSFLHGADSLVMAPIGSQPAGVIVSMEDPKLGPLQSNGGPTRTHAILGGSPAIGIGDNHRALAYDQRYTGYPRATGPNVSVDIGAVQFDTLFVDNFDE